LSAIDLHPQISGDLGGQGARLGSPRLSVIVPVHNGSKHLGRCLEALGRSDYAQFEVIVVDDCSTDNTPQIAERYGARYLRTSRTLGPGGARNLGAQHAGGEILVFVDSDVVMPPGGLSLIAEDFRRDPELAAVFGSYDDTPPWTSFISQYKNLMHHYVHQASSESAATFWAGCGAVRKTVFEEFSGFDAATYTVPSIEDIALGLEMARGGRKIQLDKRLAVKHLKRWTVRNLLRADIFYRAIPWTRLILNTRHLPRDLNLTYASRASSLLVGLLAVGCVLLPVSLIGWIGIKPVLVLGSMALISLLLLILNWDVYRFFRRKRGWWFAMRAVLAHWAYYLYSGVTFFLCAAIHFVSLPFSSTRKASVRNS
jgi:glycosyltransferase involved in cell wall biosynthesis